MLKVEDVTINSAVLEGKREDRRIEISPRLMNYCQKLFEREVTKNLFNNHSATRLRAEFALSGEKFPARVNLFSTRVSRTLIARGLSVRERNTRTGRRTLIPTDRLSESRRFSGESRRNRVENIVVSSRMAVQ